MKRVKLIFSLIIGLLAVLLLTDFIFPQTAQATDPVHYDVLADTFIHSQAPRYNYGRDREMILNFWGGESYAPETEGQMFYYHKWLMIKPNISGIPRNATIETAKLRLHIKRNSSPLGCMYRVSKITSNWSETGVTWNNRPTSVNVNVSGVFYERDDNVNIDITSLVKEWYSGRSPNYGLIVADREVTQDCYFSTREGPHEDRPWLSVRYTTPSPTPTPTPTIRIVRLISPTPRIFRVITPTPTIRIVRFISPTPRIFRVITPTPTPTPTSIPPSFCQTAAGRNTLVITDELMEETDDGGIFTWKTKACGQSGQLENNKATSWVYVDQNADNGTYFRNYDSNFGDNQMTLNHNVNVKYLDSNTRYSYVIYSKDSQGREAITDRGTFTTLSTDGNAGNSPDDSGISEGDSAGRNDDGSTNQDPGDGQDFSEGDGQDTGANGDSGENGSGNGSEENGDGSWSDKGNTEGGGGTINDKPGKKDDVNSFVSELNKLPFASLFKGVSAEKPNLFPLVLVIIIIVLVIILVKRKKLPEKPESIKQDIVRGSYQDQKIERSNKDDKSERKKEDEKEKPKGSSKWLKIIIGIIVVWFVLTQVLPFASFFIFSGFPFRDTDKLDRAVDEAIKKVEKNDSVNKNENKGATQNEIEILTYKDVPEEFKLYKINCGDKNFAPKHLRGDSFYCQNIYTADHNTLLSDFVKSGADRLVFYGHDTYFDCPMNLGKTQALVDKCVNAAIFLDYKQMPKMNEIIGVPKLSNKLYVYFAKTKEEVRVLCNFPTASACFNSDQYALYLQPPKSVDNFYKQEYPASVYEGENKEISYTFNTSIPKDCYPTEIHELIHFFNNQFWGYNVAREWFEEGMAHSLTPWVLKSVCPGIAFNNTIRREGNKKEEIKNFDLTSLNLEEPMEAAIESYAEGNTCRKAIFKELSRYYKEKDFSVISPFYQEIHKMQKSYERDFARVLYLAENSPAWLKTYLQENGCDI